MGLVIRIPSSSFKDSTSRVLLPIRDGLMGEYYFGSSMRQSLINHVPGGADLKPSGNIQVGNDEIFLPNGLARLETDITTEPQFLTMFFVGRRLDDDIACSYFSNVQGGSLTTSTGIIQAGSTGSNLGFRARDESGLNNNLALVNGYGVTENSVISMSISAASEGFKTTGRAITNIDVFETVGEFTNDRGMNLTGQPLSIGVSDGGTYAGSFYAKAASIFNRPLSIEEIFTIEEHYKNWFLR